MKPPVISIITVVFNGVDTLERTFRSVFAQTYPYIEFIVVDGGSKDGTVDLIRRYENRLSYWVSEPDNGLYDAMNKGIGLSTGDYLWFVNSGDEIFAPSTLATLFATLPQADVYYGETVVTDKQGNIIGTRRLQPPTHLTWKHFRKGMLVSHQSFIVSRKVVGLYNLHYRFSADYEWCLLALKKSQNICNSHMVLSRFLDGGLTKKNILPGLQERFTIMVQHFGFFPTVLRHLVLGARLLWFIIRHKRF
jgi:glycosyltransferase involved in cell wall biosynthesis